MFSVAVLYFIFFYFCCFINVMNINYKNCDFLPGFRNMLKQIIGFILLLALGTELSGQSISTTYSYTWKYDTIYTNGQIGSQNFTYTSSIQTFNAAPGSYTFEGWGGQGGGTRGGKGAYAKCVLTLTQSKTIYVLVGGNAGVSSQGSNYCGGGGGGTYIYFNSSDIDPILVAGGGGGQAENAYGGVGSGTTSATNSTSGNGNGPLANIGYGGNSGSNIGSYSCAAGGAGWLTDGSDGITIRNFGGEGGKAPRNGGAGGYGYHSSGYSGFGGAFGGGGANCDNTGAGGGGGGYTGGSGGNNYAGSQIWGAGGGGGSYYYGASGQLISGANSMPSTSGGTETGHSGNGYARISYNTKVIDHIDSSISYTYVTTTITDFVCKNGVYNKYGFSVDGSTLSSGVHTYTHFTQTAGKDSTTILNLTIKPGATDFVEVEAPNSYTWGINGETYTQSGIYEYSTVTADGCDSTVILALTIYTPTDGIGENSNLHPIIITPNPAKDYIDVKVPSAHPYNLAIYNIYGQICLTKKITNNETRIAVSWLPAGTYILRISETENSYRIEKFVKTN